MSKIIFHQTRRLVGACNNRKGLVKLVRIFINSAAILLCITAAAKIVSGFGGAAVLGKRDPLFNISYRDLFLVAGTMELCVAAFCVFNKNIVFRIGSVAWIMTGISHKYALGGI